MPNSGLMEVDDFPRQYHSEHSSLLVPPSGESRHSDFDKSVVAFRLGGASGGVPQSLLATASRFGLTVPEVAFIERRVVGYASGSPSSERLARFDAKVRLLWMLRGR